MSRRLVLDWRGVPDLASKRAEFYSVASTVEARPAIGNPNGRVLVGISSTLLYGPDGNVSARPYSLALYAAAKQLGALTTREVWRGENGYSSRLFDITKRGMTREWLRVTREFFPWADGFHLDWATAFSWLFPDMAPMDTAWDSALGGVIGSLASGGKLCVAQQFHLTSPVMNGSGLWLEQNPWFNRYTLAKHADDIAYFRSMIGRVDPKREIVWVSEIRYPAQFSAETLAEVESWASGNDVVLSYGRDAAAMGAA